VAIIKLQPSESSKPADTFGFRNEIYKRLGGGVTAELNGDEVCVANFAPDKKPVVVAAAAKFGLAVVPGSEHGLPK